MDLRGQEKVEFLGKIIAVQPRSNVWRYRLDNRTHSLTGYNVFLSGVVDGSERRFSVAISEKQQKKHRFLIGDMISGTAWTKKYPKLEYADYYRAGALNKVVETAAKLEGTAEPWREVVSSLSEYIWRDCRMLDGRRYRGKCFTCKWACMANVCIEYDWDRIRKYRFESFCYGPKNCSLYEMGKPRAVPDKALGTLYDEGWLDDICTERRGENE